MAHPSLIVLDMLLPYMDGYEVIEQLKRDENTNDIPILILSGAKVDKERIVQLNDCINIPILGKPIHPEELLNNVQEMVNY